MGVAGSLEQSHASCLHLPDAPLLVLARSPDDECLVELASGIRFTDQAIWARPLHHKKRTESVRATATILTGGLTGFSYAAGFPDHWAHVAKGHHPECGAVYFVSHFARPRNSKFGNLVGVPDQATSAEELGISCTANEQFLFEKVIAAAKDESRAIKEAALCVCGSEETCKIWVQQPWAGWSKLIMSSVNDPPQLENCLWSPIKSGIAFQDLRQAMRSTQALQTEYRVLTNNCQHYAEQLFCHLEGTGGPALLGVGISCLDGSAGPSEIEVGNLTELADEK